MIYISKGRGVSVTRCGKTVRLSGLRAEMWLRGQSSFTAVKNQVEEMALHDLSRLGLVETTERNTPIAQYRLLTYCTPCPARAFMQIGLAPDERTVLFWLKKAGLRLNIAELVYLMEHSICPTRDLLRARNRQALVEKIYTPWNISDNILEQQMESASCRDEVVAALLGLLKKKKVALI